MPGKGDATGRHAMVRPLDDASHQQALARRLLIALLTPVLLLLLGGVLLAFQLGRMAEDAAWVDHSQTVLATAYDAQRQMSDQESALRGFLVSGDHTYLGPYRQARPLEGLAHLRVMTTDNPLQAATAAEVQRRYEKWLELAASVEMPSVDLGELRSLDAMRERNERMDATREALNEFIARELQLRVERTAVAAGSVLATRYALAGLVIVLAGVLAWLSRHQLVAITNTYSDALRRERDTKTQIEDRDWVSAGVVALSESLRGEFHVDQVVERALRSIATRLGAEVGAGFIEARGGWTLRAGHGFEPSEPLVVPRGDGLLGRAVTARGAVWLDELPHDYLRIRSGLGDAGPHQVVAIPAIADDHVGAVLELGFLRTLTMREREFIDRVGEPLGVAVRSAEYAQRLRRLLEQEQRHTEELQSQQEELRVANEELEQQGAALREAHAQLEERQQELEEANAVLEGQTLELRHTERELATKAADLARSSRYKSEFLANMSHELRTPLNSTLILAKMLADNEPGTLTSEQVRFAETIHMAGNDLLALISDILDLGKIEAGRMELRPSKTNIAGLIEPVMRGFEPLATNKGLELISDHAELREIELVTDVQRVQQVLKNLLSNAIKFTETGRVSIAVSIAGERLNITVEDTGIGFPSEEAEIIFEAFRQADGTASRKYGGTGLGLAISRDFARLLGGGLTADSVPGSGSSFRLVLPLTQGHETPIVRPERIPSAAPLERQAPERQTAARRDNALLLIVEDDANFAGLVADVARDLGYRSAIASTGALGLELAQSLAPRAILLDLRLPDLSGLGVLDALKQDQSTRHIPVHVVSGFDHAEQALALGAAGYVTKPVTRDELAMAVRKLESLSPSRPRHVLLVEDDAAARESVMTLLEGPDLEIRAVTSANEALAALREATFDCMITDLGLPDKSGVDLLRTIVKDESLAFPPVIVYTGRKLTEGEEAQLRGIAPAIILKGARSPERLLDEVTLFLHRVETDLPPDRQRMLRRVRDQESKLTGRSVLIAEDDIRNVFALTSALEQKGIKVIIARNGREALQRLDEQHVDLVLMDIMMPEMDGIEAMRRIRATKAWSKLPIIALTAKAMPDDREECLAAGANDYVPKPLQMDRLLSLIRVWMPAGVAS